VRGVDAEGAVQLTCGGEPFDPAGRLPGVLRDEPGALLDDLGGEGVARGADGDRPGPHEAEERAHGEVRCVLRRSNKEGAHLGTGCRVYRGGQFSQVLQDIL